MVMRGKRGQVYTLQGVIGALLVASALVLGLQAVDVAPWANDPTGQNSEQLRTEVSDILEVAHDEGALRTAVTCVGDNDTPDSRIATSDNVTKLGSLLDRELTGTGTDYIVLFDYLNESGSTQRRVIYPQPQPRPTAGAVTATYQFTLHGTDHVHEVEAGECTPQDRTLREDDDFYIEDMSGGLTANQTSYNTVRVRVIAWR